MAMEGLTSRRFFQLTPQNGSLRRTGNFRRKLRLVAGTEQGRRVGTCLITGDLKPQITKIGRAGGGATRRIAGDLKPSEHGSWRTLLSIAAGVRPIPLQAAKRDEVGLVGGCGRLVVNRQVLFKTHPEHAPDPNVVALQPSGTISIHSGTQNDAAAGGQSSTSLEFSSSQTNNWGHRSVRHASAISASGPQLIWSRLFTHS